MKKRRHRQSDHLLFFLIAVVLSLPGCQAQPATSIQGNIRLAPGWKPTIYLIQPRHFQEVAADYLGQVIDSATIATDGSFTFDPSSLPAGKAILQVCVQPNESRYANHLIDDPLAEANYMPIVYIPGEKVGITATSDRFQSTFAIGCASRENGSLLRLRDLRREAYETYLRRASVLEEDSMLIEKEHAYATYLAALMVFADSTSTPEAAVVAIRWVSPTNDFERIPEFLVRQCARWRQPAREVPFLEEICALAKPEKLAVQVGDMIPNFPLPMSGGDTVMLYSLLGSRMTILDIWASWCAPCRKENKTVLLPAWHAYHAQGLQIIGYSIDAQATAWKGAIQKDGTPWPHASHLTGDSTPFMDALRISTIPANYILDPHGYVLAKNVHGEELIRMIRNK